MLYLNQRVVLLSGRFKTRLETVFYKAFCFRKPFLWGNMGILDLDIKQTSPKIVMVDSAYLSYLHGFDSRVSLKKDRPYVGLAVRINDKVYVIPLTSQTTQERKKKGLKKRNSLTTDLPQRRIPIITFTSSLS